MSFGFSASDAVAIGRLIVELTSCLKDASGSKSDYQELARELALLQHALRYLDRLSGQSPSSTLESIKYAALSCRRPLEQLLGKLKKYEKGLGQRATAGAVRSAADKIRWRLEEKKEVRKLQSYLSIHVETINILLAEHGLQKMDLASERAQQNHAAVRNMLDQCHSVLAKVKRSAQAQMVAVQYTSSTFIGLVEMLNNECVSTWRFLTNMATKVCVITQQTHALALEMKAAIVETPDVRWTFFQAPLLVEDALGRKFPVPSEYNYELLDSVVQYKFNTGPGASYVKAEQYELVDTKDRSISISKDAPLLPGTAITMAILIRKPRFVATGEICPLQQCGSTKIAKASFGGKVCCKCNVWFDHREKVPRPLRDVVGFLTSSVLHRSSSDEIAENIKPSGKRRKLDIPEERDEVFHNAGVTVKELSRTLHVAAHKSSLRDFPCLFIAGQLRRLTYADTPGIVSSELIQQVDWTEIQNFFNQVKSTYKHKPAVYYAFLIILRDYSLHQDPVAIVVERISELLAENRSVLHEFFRVIPQLFFLGSIKPTWALWRENEQFIGLNTSITREAIEILDNALIYLRRLLAVCSHSRLMAYNDYIQLRRDFKRGDIDERTLYHRISDIFANDAVSTSKNDIRALPSKESTVPRPVFPLICSQHPETHHYYRTSDFRTLNPVLGESLTNLEHMERNERRNEMDFKFLRLIYEDKNCEASLCCPSIKEREVLNARLTGSGDGQSEPKRKRVQESEPEG